MPASRRAPSNGLLAFASGIACLVYTIDSSIANVALPHIQGDLQASHDQIGWVLTAYVISSAIMLPLAGFLALRFGFRPVIIASTAAFTAASVLCGLAGSLEALVLFRALQGIAGAALVPISQVLLLSAFPIEQAGWAMALWGMGVMGGPVIGPLVGGFLTEALSWRWVFFVNLPVGVLAVSLLMAAVPRTVQSPTRRFDYLGFLLLAAAIGFGQLFLDRGNSVGWFDSPEILAEAFFAAVCLYMFIVHSLTTEHPFLDLHLFRDRNFVVGLLTSFLVGILIYVVVTLMPLFLQQLQGHTPMQAGLLIAPRGVGTMLAMLIAGRAMTYVDARLLAGIGAVLMAIASVPMMHLTVDIGSGLIIACGVLHGIGIGMVTVPLSTLIFATLRTDLRTEAGVVSSLSRNIGSSIGISVVLMLLSRSTQSNHARLVEYLTPFDPARWDSAREALGDRAMPVLAEEVGRQAAVIAYNNDFALVLGVAVIVLPLLALFRKPRRVPA